MPYIFRALIAVAELSFGELTWPSSGTRNTLSSVYFCTPSSLTDQGSLAFGGMKFNFMLTWEKVHTIVDGNKITVQACWHPQKPSQVL